MALLELGLLVGTWALNKWVVPLFDEDGKYRPPKPEGLEFTQATIGDPIPLVYGTVRVNSAVAVWDGRQAVTDFGGGDFLYHFALLLVVGIPPYDKYDDPVTPASEVAPFTTWRTLWPVKWKRFWYGDSEIFNVPPAPAIELEHGDIVDPVETNWPSPINNIYIRVEFFDGRRNQVITTYPAATVDPSVTPGTPVIDWLMDLALVDRAQIPGYRHQMLAVIDASKHPTIGANDFSVGRDHVVPTLGLEIQALGPEPIDDGAGSFDANPVWVIWDLLLSPVWKVGYSQDRVDLTSFRAAATTMVDESHGISLAIYERTDAAKIITGILKQIDGILFEDPSTGKLKLKLIRQDYVVAALPVLNADNTIGKPQITVHGWRGMANALHVSYSDRSQNYERERASAWRLATNGGVVARLNAKEVEFTGVTTFALAQTIAERELAESSRPFVSVTAKVNREFFSLLPGDAVLGYWPPLGIVDKVFRVLDVDLGQLDDGAITVTLVEDVHDATQEAVPPWGGVLDPEF